MYDTFDEENYEPIERLNKSQQKREIKALHDLAVKLSKLDLVALERMELPPELFKSLVEVQSMKHGAEKRQFKFIVRLLREHDTENLLETVSNLEAKKEEQTHQFHRVERWRDRLLTEGQVAITEFMTAFPQADSGQIRQLVRNANQELQASKPPKSQRALFQLLKSEMI